MKAVESDGITILPFSMDNYTQAWELWDRSLPHSHDNSWNYAMTGRFLRHNPELCFSAFKGEQLIGTVMGSFDGRRGYIQHLAVDQSCRRSGTGRALMKKVTDAMREMDIRKVHLMVKNDNITVQEFYEKLSWDAREDITIMSIRLKEEEL